MVAPPISPALQVSRPAADTRGKSGRSVLPRAALFATAAALTLVTCVITLTATGGGPAADLPAGLPEPGPIVGWGLRVIRPVELVAGVLTVGSLLIAAGMAPRDQALIGRSLRATRRTAAVWSLTGVIGFVLTVCDTTGVPLTALSAAQLLPWRSSAASTAHLALALGAAAVALAAVPRRSTLGARVLLVVALGSALSIPATGHSAAVDDGGVSLSGLLVHVLAALLWTGGLAALLLHLRSDRTALAVAVPRFSMLALGAYLTLACSGLAAVSAALPLSGPGMVAAWSSGYAGVVVAKVAVLAVLGWFGVRHRLRTLPRILAGEPRAFLRLASVELPLMAVAAGMATALTRTPLPEPLSGTTGHTGPLAALDELSMAALVTSWRPNVVVLLVVAVALTAYVGATRSFRGGVDGQRWPRRWTACFVAGSVVTLVTLCSGIATFAPLLLSIHVAQLLVMLLAVPSLLLLGRPAQLARAARSRVIPPYISGILSAPATGAVATFVLLTVVYRTPLVVLTLGSPWWHLLVLLLAVVCGLTLLWPLLGDDAASGRSRRWERASWLMTVAVTLAVLARQLRTSDQLLAASWFTELGLGWVAPLADQRLAGAVIAVAAASVTVLAGAVLMGVVVGRQGDATRSPSSPSNGQIVSSTRPSRSPASSGP